MKCFLVLVASFFIGHSYAQTDADKIIGRWMKMPKEDLIIDVFPTGGGYSGRIEWSKDSSKQKGYVIIENLQFDDESDTWENGSIHDPRSGNRYKAAAKLTADGTLEVLGYKGVKFIGRKRSFKRVK